MADPYEVDKEGNPIAAEPEVVEAPGPEADDPLRRQVEVTLRFMATATVVGLVIIAILAVVLADVRGILILVGIVYLLTSLATYWYLRRNLTARLKRGASPSGS